MIYQQKQCSNSGQKRNDIGPLESDFIVQPRFPLDFPGPLPPPPPPPHFHSSGISNSLHGGSLDIFWNHTFHVPWIILFPCYNKDCWNFELHTSMCIKWHSPQKLLITTQNILLCKFFDNQVQLKSSCLVVTSRGDNIGRWLIQTSLGSLELKEMAEIQATLYKVLSDLH